MTAPDAAEALIRHVVGLRATEVPAPTLRRAKLLVLDTLGAALAAVDADGVRQVRDVVRRWGGAPEAVLIGTEDRAPAPLAALVNATMARALELDDVHETALTHATATMVPVALATAPADATGLELLAAVALGVDAGVRLSLTPTTDLGGDAYAPRSMSRTYQTGVLAGSLVAARMRGVGEEVARDTLGNAYSQCFGNLQGLVEGTLTVRVGQGVAAQLAVQACDLATAGISGVRQPLEGKYGWLQCFWGGRYDLDALLGGLGSRFEVERVSVKPYACCKYAHTAIAAALEVREDPAFDVEAVERVRVHVFSADCWDLLCEPLAVKASPAALAGDNGWGLAQFSFPYTVACALARGALTTAELTLEARTDPTVVGLLAKIDPVLEDVTRGMAELPEPGVVEVDLAGGRHLEAKVDRAIGHPDRPMDAEAQLAKFRWCTAGLERRRAEAIADAVMGLETLPAVSELTDLLGGALAG